MASIIVNTYHFSSKKVAPFKLELAGVEAQKYLSSISYKNIWGGSSLQQLKSQPFSSWHSISLSQMKKEVYIHKKAISSIEVNLQFILLLVCVA